MEKTAPAPIFGFFGQAPSDGIAMNVAELFDEFLLSENIEVVIAALPELLSFTLEPLGCLCLQGAEDVFEL